MFKCHGELSADLIDSRIFLWKLHVHHVLYIHICALVCQHHADSLIDSFSKGDNAFAAGEYVAVFDLIDGSKNIDSSLPVGTVFGIYKCTPGTSPTDETFLQKGDEMVAAGYCLYS